MCGPSIPYISFERSSTRHYIDTPSGYFSVPVGNDTATSDERELTLTAKLTAWQRALYNAWATSTRDELGLAYGYVQVNLTKEGKARKRQPIPQALPLVAAADKATTTKTKRVTRKVKELVGAAS